MKKNNEKSKYTIADLPALEKKYNKARQDVLVCNCLYTYNDFEIDYLLSGHATEIIDTVLVRPRPKGMKWEEWMELKQGAIYGVVAKEQDKNRYVWHYFRYQGLLIRCNGLEDAYKKAAQVKIWNELDDIVDNLQRLKYRQIEKNKKAKVERLKTSKPVTKSPLKSLSVTEVI